MRHPLLSPARSDFETNRVGFEEVAGILINFYGASRTPQLRTTRCRFHCPHFGTKPCKGRNFSASNERGVCSHILRCMGDDECVEDVAEWLQCYVLQRQCDACNPLVDFDALTHIVYFRAARQQTTVCLQ